MAARTRTARTATTATEPAKTPARRGRKPAAEPAAPAPAKRAAKSEPETLGTAWLVEHLTDMDIDLGANPGLNVRNALRKLSAEGTIDHDRQSRYVFTGPRDEVVRAVVAHFKAAPVRKSRDVAPAPAKKAAPAAKRTAAKAPAAKPAPRKSRAKAAPAPEVDVEDFEDDDDLDEI